MKMPRACLFILPLLLLSAPSLLGQAVSTLHPEKVLGNTNCAGCHEEEFKAWRASSHSRSAHVFRRKDAKGKANSERIATAMGMKNAAAMVSSPLCTECHFTRQKKDGSLKVIGGVSCESCHGGAKDYIEIHCNPYEIGSRKERQKLSKAAGMLHSDDTYLVAENCFSCHIVHDEKLVNVGGHPARSEGFNLVGWTGGEVRHNFYTPDYIRETGKNLETVQNRRRKMQVVGLLLDLEFSLRGLAKVTTKGNFRNAMGRRTVAIRDKELPDMIAKLGGDAAPAELKKILAAAKAVPLGDAEALIETADTIKKSSKALSDSHDGSGLSGVDSLISTKTRGAAWQP